MTVGRIFSLLLLFVYLQVQLSIGETNESLCPPTLQISWLEKPPYTTSPTEVTSHNELQGLFKDILSTFISGICCDMSSEMNQTRVHYESNILDNCENDKAQIGLPVTAIGREAISYKGFHFTGIVDYPGADFITLAESKHPGTVVTLTVLRSWPLLAVTTVLMAIAGIVMWALDTAANVGEFPRSFFRGSWEGFWWSFISMTTVGYGDKAPKSALGRLFAMVWILTGLVIMAIFMANITSALTSMSLEPTNKNINGKEVAVLGNGTEYNIAQEEGAEPKVFKTFDEMVRAVKSKQVGGLLVDRFTGYYYMAERNYTGLSLITSQHIEKMAKVGLVFAQGREDLIACLNLVKVTAIKSVESITSKYKAPRQPTPPESHSIYETGSGPLKIILYIALGILGILVIVGIIWECLIRKNQKKRLSNSFRISFTKRKSDRTLMIQKASGEAELRRDLEEGRKLLQQLQEYFDKLETRSRDQLYHKLN